MSEEKVELTAEVAPMAISAKYVPNFAVIDHTDQSGAKYLFTPEPVAGMVDALTAHITANKANDAWLTTSCNRSSYTVVNNAVDAFVDRYNTLKGDYHGAVIHEAKNGRYITIDTTGFVVGTSGSKFGTVAGFVTAGEVEADLAP